MRTILILTLAACTGSNHGADTDADTDLTLVEQTVTGACDIGGAVAWEVPEGTASIVALACVEDDGTGTAEPVEHCWDRGLSLDDVGADGYLRFTCVNDGSMLGTFWRVVYVAPPA